MNKTSNHAERKFGILLVIVFGFLGLYGKHRNWDQFSVVSFLLGALFFVAIAIFVPKTLGPLNRLYLSLGNTMGRIVSPITLGVIFFFIITPVSYLGKLFKRDELNLLKQEANSYWIDNELPVISAESFKLPY